MSSETGSIGRSSYVPSTALTDAVYESVRKDGSFLDAAEKALKSVLAVKASENNGKEKITSNDLAIPLLNQPTQKAKEELNSAGKLALLLGNLMSLLGESTLSQFESRLATWRAMMESQKSMGEQLSIELQNALGGAEQATELYQTTLSTLTTTKAAFDAATKALQQAQAQLDKLSTSDAGYTQALSARDQAANESKNAKQKVDQAELLAKDAHSNAMTKANSVDKLLTQIQGVGIQNSLIQPSEQNNLSNVAKLTMLMAMFVELIGKNSEESLQNDLALFQALQEGRQKEMEKKSSEYLEEVRKAEELNRIMGCIGKILGALLTIVSVVSAAFTGGASLALAAVGIALMVADEIVKATTGMSFMEEALKPLMDKVLKPLMELIGKAITKALESFGVDKKTAELAGSIAGAILAAVAMVVVVVVVALVGKGAAAKLGNAMSKLLGDAIKKIVPEVMKELAKGGSKLLSQGMQRLSSVLGDIGSKLGLQTDAISKQLITNTLQRTLIVGEVVNVATQAGGNLAQGVFMKNASDAMADFSLAHASMAQLEQWMKQAVENFAETQKITQEMNRTMSAALQQNAEAGRFVMRQAASAA